MGFPVGCSELMLPKFLIYLVFLLATIRRFVALSLSTIGLGDLLEPVPDVPHPSSSAWSIPHSGSHRHHSHGHQGTRSMSASLILESLPATPYKKCCGEEEEGDEEEEGESCAVCLYEFKGGEEVRRLSNCRHVFHRCCIDSWVEIDQRTCPLCRTPLIPDEMRAALDQKISSRSAAAPDAADLYSEIYYGVNEDYYPLLDDSLDLLLSSHEEIISLPPVSQFSVELR